MMRLFRPGVIEMGEQLFAEQLSMDYLRELLILINHLYPGLIVVLLFCAASGRSYGSPSKCPRRTHKHITEIPRLEASIRGHLAVDYVVL